MADGVLHCLDVSLITNGFFENVTLRTLMNVCIVCKKTPTAPALAFALQNSLPSLTGLPMDNGDPAFYLEIARTFFDPYPVTFLEQVSFSRRVHFHHGVNLLFPYGLNLDAPSHDPDQWMIDYWVERTVSDLSVSMLRTKKGRAFVREAMVNWHRQDPAHIRLINRVISVLDHGMVLRWRQVLPGRMHDEYRHPYGDDEHE
jgi:hypothetical protein